MECFAGDAPVERHPGGASALGVVRPLRRRFIEPSLTEGREGRK